MPRNILYDFLIWMFGKGMALAALFSPKAKLWQEGRKNWRNKLKKAPEDLCPTFWMHVSSLGEFEQGRTLFEAFRQSHPDWYCVLTFFSPSGYELRKNYPAAHEVLYLPLDTRANAQDFVQRIKPTILVVVKYDFWNNHLHAALAHGTQCVLISALFRSGQPFFQFYGGFWRSMLRCFHHIFVQDEQSVKLLQGIGISDHVSIAHDTRIDRVLEIASQPKDFPVIAALASRKKLIILGSVWKPDEQLWLEYLSHYPIAEEVAFVIAPHVPNDEACERLLSTFPQPSARMSALLLSEVTHLRTVVVDGVGYLNQLYQFGKVAYIGGGFGSGIHNTLEPAAWGLPVIFGPKYLRFEEAKGMVANKGAFSVKNTAELANCLQPLLFDELKHQESAAAARGYLLYRAGGTRLILEEISRKDA